LHPGAQHIVPVMSQLICCERKATPCAHSRSYLMRFALLYFLGEPRKNGQDIANNTEVGDGEDGRVLIFVDGHDIFRTLHACQVLNGSTDAASDIECWFDWFACLINLVAVRQL